MTGGPYGPDGDAGPRSRPGTLGGSGGAKLRTRAWLPESGEVRGRVVIVHGLGEHCGRYGEFARFATSRGLAVLAYDQRGHGSSEGRRGVVGRFDDYLVDLEAVLIGAGKQLPGSGEPVLIGHSLGGLVALRYLQTRTPELPGAVLSAPWLATAARIPLWKRLAAAVLQRVAPDLSLATGMDPAALTRDPVKQREYEEDPLVHDRVSAGLHGQVRRAQERTLADAPSGRIPLLFLVPLDDEIVDPAVTLDYARRLDGPVTVESLEGARHEPLNEVGRSTVYRTVTDWIEGVLDREPPPGDRVSS